VLSATVSRNVQSPSIADYIVQVTSMFALVAKMQLMPHSTASIVHHAMEFHLSLDARYFGILFIIARNHATITS